MLGQLKDYDEALTQELAAKAYQEQERQRLEVRCCINIFRTSDPSVKYSSMQRLQWFQSERRKLFTFALTLRYFIL